MTRGGGGAPRRAPTPARRPRPKRTDRGPKATAEGHSTRKDRPWTSPLSGISTVVGAAVGLYGGYHLLFGALKVSDAIKDGQGMSMNSGLGQLVGGAIIVAVAGGFVALAQTWPY